MATGDPVDVVPDEGFVAGIVLGADEVRAVTDDDSLHRQSGAHCRPVGHRREDARVRPAMPAGTGAAIVGGEMRVIATVRTVTDDDYQRRQVPGQTDGAQEAGDARHLLVLAETQSRRRGAGDAGRLGRLGGQLQLARRPLLEAIAPAPKESPEPSRGERPRQQSEQCRRRGDDRQQRRLQPAAPATLVQAFAPDQARLPTPLMPLCGHRGNGRRGLAHRVLGPYDDWAKGRRHLVVEALPKHRDTEEAGGAESLESRIDFLEMAARSLLAIVHAQHELRLCSARERRCPAVIGDQGRQDLLPIVVLVGEQPDPTTLVGAQRDGAGVQRGCADRPHFPQFASAESQPLRQREQRPGRQRLTIARRFGSAARVDQLRGEPLPVIPFPFPFPARQGEARPDEIEHLLRHLPAAASVPHRQFGRVTDEMLAERRQPQRQTPDAAHELLAIQAFEDDPHSEKVSQADRRVASHRVRLAPAAHPRPARQLQRQSLQAGAPLRLLDTEPEQFAGNGLQRILGQLLDVMPRPGNFVELPCPVATGTLSPCRIETLAARRIPPGRQALIEMGAEVTNQRGVQHFASVLAGQVSEQGAERPLAAETPEQVLPQHGGSLRRGLARIAPLGFAPPRRCHRVQFARGRPEVGDSGSFVVAVKRCGSQQTLARRRVEIRRQPLEGGHFLAPPAQTSR